MWVPLTVALMRFGFGWRIEGASEARAIYRELRRHPAPVLVCANHLTLIDSAVIAWALGSPWWYLRHFSALPWNVPERTNFAASASSRVLLFLMKCVPITRGSDRRQIARVFERLAELLADGEAVLLFPEGGRSRTGRVDPERLAYGVGRLVSALPGCRVLCVYLRGDSQRTFGDLPARGERFRVRVEVLEPTSEHGGLRGSVEISRQVLERLAALERLHFAEASP